MGNGLRKNIEWEVQENGCWNITSHVKNGDNGYCKFHRYGKKQFVHRYIYEELFGEIPKGMVVRHKCDNKLCINPEHLIVGTQEENTIDAIERARYKRGEDNNMSKLTKEQVLKIRASKKSRKELSKEYGMSKQGIDSIINRLTWRWV